jgi:hypothetical protein
MAGSGTFNIIGYEVLESEGGRGVLWCAKVAFADFVLELEWRLSSIEANSGVYVCFPSLSRDNPEQD